MNIFGLNISLNSQKDPEILDDPNEFNGQFGSIGNISVGDRDLSKPFIDDNYVVGNGRVYFGEDDLYPSLLNNLYRSSPIHATCINFKTNSIVGGGYEFDGYDNASVDVKKKIKVLEIRHKIKKTNRKIVKDFIKHGRACILLKYSEKGKRYVKSIVIDPENVRNDRVTIWDDKPEKYFISEDFKRYGAQKTIRPYSPGRKDVWQMLELRTDTAGLKTYPLPDYISNGNWVYLDGEISYLYKQGIVNSINPSMIFMFPFGTNATTKRSFRNMLIQSGKGARNMGRVLAFWRPKDQLPEIKTVQTTQNDKLYTQVSSEIKDNIAMSHQMDPAIIGVKTSGKLGNAQELRMQYSIFEKNWVMENTETVEDFMNDFLRILDCPLDFKYKKFDIIGDLIEESKTKE